MNTRDQSAIESKKNYSYLLDCFRVLAMVMVLSVHIIDNLRGIPVLVYRLFSLGAYGVALFFLLSGYFAYPSLNSSRDIKAYICKKVVRILPMYYVSLSLTFIIGVFVTGEYPLDIRWLYHVFFVNMFIPSPQWNWWNSVNYFWTMPVFMAWYMVSPLLHKWVRGVRKLVCLIIVTLILTPCLKNWCYTFAHKQFVNWNFFCLLYVFLIGVLAYYILEERKQKIGIVYGVIIAIVGVLTKNKSGFLVFGVGFYFLIILASFLPIKWENQRVNVVVKFLSKITYSVYLTHWFVLVVMKSILLQLPWIVGYIIFLLFAGVVGWIAYQFIEVPMNRYIRNLFSK